MRLPLIAPALLASLLLVGAAPIVAGCEGDGFENAGEELDEATDEAEEELD